jgi:nicotinate-nucleotide--dimethylbenzimidazole phosphoribosyltransferase
MSMTIKEICSKVTPPDEAVLEEARKRTASLLMPERALGELHAVSEKLCALSGTLTPDVKRKAFLVFAGDHGVVAEGVSAYPQEVTAQMIKAFISGKAAINVLAGMIGAEVFVVDAGVATDIDAQIKKDKRFFDRKTARGTRNFAEGPAMARNEAEKALIAGFELASDVFGEGVAMLGLGDMGIGNTTAASAIGAAVTGRPLEEMTGKGTGIAEETLRHKREVIKKAIEVNRPDRKDALDVLSKVGGFEIAGIAGAALAGAVHKRVVVIDGLISTAGALVAHGLCPAVSAYLFAGHESEEPGHKHMLSHLGLRPLLRLGMRLGEGTGAALAMHLIVSASRIIQDMGTFEDMGVSGAL